MINIYTDWTGFDKKALIIDNDAYFDENVTAHNFEELENEAIEVIDDAKVLDYNIGTIQTPRGVGALENLSSGCKTVLNYLYLYRNKIGNIKAIDVSECGANALEELFEIIEKSKYPIDLVIRHKDRLYMCRERQYKVDGDCIISNLMYL